MNTRLPLRFMTICSVLVGSAVLTADNVPDAAVGARDRSTVTVGPLAQAHGPSGSTAGAKHLSRLTRRELAQARRATAKYHDVANALADGYVDANLHTPGEGFHYANNLLIDDHFNLEQPEVLLYASRRPGADLKLVGVEYVVPNTFPVPDGFTGDADVWQSEPPFPIWVLNAWIWRKNPDGIFTFLNPRVP